MTSERQITANRRNARRSRGPRSNAGKRHSSANALRHGLSRAIGARGDPEMEALAHLLVGDNADEERLELARSVVRAHFDLLRIREVKRDLMERLYRSARPVRRVVFAPGPTKSGTSRACRSTTRCSGGSGLTPQPRCHWTATSERQKPCGACCQTCASSTVTRGGRLRPNKMHCANLQDL